MNSCNCHRDILVLRWNGEDLNITDLNEEFLLPMDITQYHLAKSIGVDA